MVQIKRDWFDTEFEKLRKWRNVWQMEREDTSYPEDRARVIRVIAGIANNINQVVKLGNSQGKLYYSDIDKLQNSLDDVKKTFGEVLEVWRLQRS